MTRVAATVVVPGRRNVLDTDPHPGEGSPMSGTTTRVASPDDADLVGRLLHDFNVEFDSPTSTADILAGRFRDLLARDDVLVLLADADSGVAGFAFLTLRPTPYHDGSFAQLEELYVLPPLRDGGIGTVLLTGAVERVHAKGAGEVHINVDEVDADTRSFYERHGFSNVQPGTDERMLCYLREL